MRVWNAMCATLLSGSGRRGAMIATLRCDHPDIGLFIDAKRERGAFEHFNLSVQVTDAFMQAVAEDRPWALLFPLQTGAAADGRTVALRHWPGREGAVPCVVTQELPARRLWQQLMDANYDSGEPGVLFVDRINAMNNLHWRETLSCTNPCGEVPLPPHGACNLGSLVLPRFVCAPFTASAHLDFTALAEAAALAVRLLDTVIDCSRYPLSAQAAMARAMRRIGLGLTGLADALLMLGLHYGSEAAREAAARVMQCICLAAYRSSCDLAREKGAFPAFERDAYLAGRFIRQLPEDIRGAIASHGIRNSHLLAIAPAGTISLLAGNVSSGIEPVFAWEQGRRILDAQGAAQDLVLVDPAWQQWREAHAADAPLPQHFVTADALNPREHLLMQAALQSWVDSAISKTVNVPADCGRAEFADLYLQAHALGLKGCTTFRSGCRGNSILQDAGCGACDTE
jgi:ribonucleoside-diphosphate reductase alpha chain